jgi:hypothetical protein
MSERLKILELHKENYILRSQIFWKEIISHRLALLRITETKENIEIELSKANSFNLSDHKEESRIFYLYMPFPMRWNDIEGKRISKNDKVNYMPGKAVCNFGKEEISGFISNCDSSLSMCEDLHHFISHNLEKYEIMFKDILNVIEEIKLEIEKETHEYKSEIDLNIKKISIKKRKSLEENSDRYIEACIKLQCINPNPYQLEEYYDKQVSKSAWDRYLKKEDFLNIIFDKIDKRRYDQMNDKTKEFWVNLSLSIRDKIDKLENRKIMNKNVSFDDRLNYTSKRFEELSHEFDE